MEKGTDQQRELALRGQAAEVKCKLPGGQENGNSQTNKWFLNKKLRARNEELMSTKSRN